MTLSGRNSLSGIVVGDAMRKQVNGLHQSTSLSTSINTLIKHKINGLLSLDEKNVPIGVLSKTDLMGAYYAGMPLDAPIEHIMSRPPLFCRVDAPLEAALEKMKEHGVYRLYVAGDDETSVSGSLAYPDIVGLLYQYCCRCEYSHHRRLHDGEDQSVRRSLVGDCMTRDVKRVSESDSLVLVMEALSAHKMGAILVADSMSNPVGVISKTDLILAYKHRVDPGEAAHRIMTSPVRSCKTDDLLEEAIRTMIFSDLHRLFVSEPEHETVVGVFTLTDAARNRSGSCHACISSRITV